MSYPDKIRFAKGESLSGVRTIEKSWSQIAHGFTKGHRAYKDKAESSNAPNILGGPTDNRGKEHINILGRSLITLDFDNLDPDVVVDDFAFLLDMLGYAAIAYTTFSHKTERANGSARLRVIVPLEHEIDKETYPAAARALADEIGFPVGKESFIAAQVMFMPSCMEGFEDQAWSYVVDGRGYPVDAGWSSQGRIGAGAGGNDLDDFMLDIAYEPMDVTDAEVDKALEMYPADGLEYDDWLCVGLALWHQYRGSLGDDGFGRWLDWSEKSQKHDARSMRTKWKSAGGRANPITMASVLARAGGLVAVRDAIGGDADEDGDGNGGADGDGGADVSVAGLSGDAEGGLPEKPKGALAIVEKLSEKAKHINNVSDYDALKQAVLRIPESKLGSDYRGMIAEGIHIFWGKSVGLSKTDIKKALTPDRKKGGAAGGAVGVGAGGAGGVVTEADCWDEERPWWLQGWVYDETDSEFVQIETGHYIKRESFRMKFDRMSECVEHEVDAVSLASKAYPIPTISGRMYWPGMARIFQRVGGAPGLSYLNTWHDGGGSSVKAAPEGSFEVGDDSLEGQACAVFLEHLDRTIADERERRLVLDWMSWVYREPGSRVRWALLLWGIEGNGKSYFHRVMTYLMGRDSRTVAASTIEERFTGWAEGCRLVGIEEIRVSGTNKWRTLDKMKPFISNDEIEVEKKGADPKVVPNFASYMLFTNHADAIPVGDGDRRYFVVFTKHRRKQDLLEEHGGVAGVSRYFKRLFDVSLAGAAGIGRLLLDHEYSSEFDPHGRAPDSEGKNQMRLMHISEEDEALTEALERFKGDYINDSIIDLTELQKLCGFESDIELPKGTHLSHKLIDLGYNKLGRMKARKEMRTIWYRGNKISAEDAARAARGGGINGIDPDVPF